MFDKIFISLSLSLLIYTLYLSSKGFVKYIYINHSISLILIIILIIWSKKLINSKKYLETFEVDHNLKFTNNEKYQLDASNTSLGGTTEHLEIAYKLCQSNPDKICQKYVTQYDGLRKTFHKLKDDYCEKYPSRCMELGI